MAGQQVESDGLPQVSEKPRMKNGKWLNIILIAAIVLLAAGIVYLLITMNQERKETEEMRVALEMQKENLTRELTDLYSRYDELNTQNDSMNSVLDREKQKIQELLQIKASNARKIQIYEKELGTLREALKSFIVQVDSLNQANLRLRAENQEVKQRFDEARNINRQLEDQNKNLTDKVEQAAVIKAVNIIAEPISDNGTVQKRLRRATKIRVCFTLSDNPVAKRGLKKVYLRISNPNERIMVKSGTNTFKLDGADIPYSAMRELEYEGDALEACIYYDAEEGEIIAGTYYIDLYLEGGLIGTTSFSLQ